MESVKAFQEGYNAGLLGKPAVMCPYESNTTEYKSWLRGHKRGHELVWFVSISPVKEVNLGGKKHV